MPTRIQYGGTIATLDPGSGRSWWKCEPEREAEHALLDSLVDQLSAEGKLGASNPHIDTTIVEAARDKYGAEIIEVEPPDEFDPDVKY